MGEGNKKLMSNTYRHKKLSQINGMPCYFGTRSKDIQMVMQIEHLDNYYFLICEKYFYL